MRDYVRFAITSKTVKLGLGHHLIESRHVQLCGSALVCYDMASLHKPEACKTVQGASDHGSCYAPHRATAVITPQLN